MAGLRVLCETTFPLKGNFCLEGDESHHLLRVLRAKVGEAVSVMDGRGGVAEGYLLRVEGKRAIINIQSVTQSNAMKPRVCLAQALPKGRLLEDILKQGVELGLAQLQPLYTQRTEVHLTQEREAKRQERLHAIAAEACKQSGNPFLPQLEPFKRLSEYLEKMPIAPQGEVRLIASLETGAVPLPKVLKGIEGCEQVTLLVGPEGDFSRDEYAAARLAGFVPVRLTVSVLRLETACLYGLSVIISTTH